MIYVNVGFCYRNLLIYKNLIFQQIMSSDEGDQSHYTRIKQRVHRKIDHVKGDVLQGSDGRNFR
jgi:hypothetical protein